jgi:hypothetical protein
MKHRSGVVAGLLASAAAASIITGCGSSDPASGTAAATGNAVGTSAARSGVTDGLRNSRYCEVIPITVDGDHLIAHVYSTQGVSDCPDEVWSTLTAQGVMRQYKAIQARLNGPRYWTLDGVSAGGVSRGGGSCTFGSDPGLETVLRATITARKGEGTIGPSYYRPNEVRRDTVVVFKEGRPVFELTDPDGRVYIMQSYARFVDAGLDYDQLAELGSRLDLPDGWRYSTRTLDDDYALSTAGTDGIAYVLMDDLGNSYQRRV